MRTGRLRTEALAMNPEKMKGGVSVSVKSCYMCKTLQPLDAFWKNQNACKNCQRQYRRDNLDRKQKSGRFAWEYGLRSKFNLTPDEYFDLLEQQEGVCAICGKDELGRRLAVDHCHETKAVRGLLCRKCNMGIGLLGDDPEILQKALRYLTA